LESKENVKSEKKEGEKTSKGARKKRKMQIKSQLGTNPQAIYRLLAMFQDKVAEKYDTTSGSEMLAGAKAAKEVGADVALIDMDSIEVFRKIWGNMSFKEKIRLGMGSVASLFVLFVNKSAIDKEIKDFEDHTEEYLKSFEHQMPTLKRVLIDERNEYMASNIRKLSEKYKNIIALIGDGHVEGLRTLLSDMNPEVVRLSQLRTDIQNKKNEKSEVKSSEGEKKDNLGANPNV
ncbi:MAG: TraB/GumN family protein, partial [Thermoplasmata archaeon]